MDFISRLTIGSGGISQYPQPLSSNFTPDPFGELRALQPESPNQQQLDYETYQKQTEMYTNFGIKPI